MVSEWSYVFILQTFIYEEINTSHSGRILLNSDFENPVNEP